MKHLSQEKVAVAVSGGVDSGVTAALLIKKGYQCEAFHLRLCHQCSSFESLKFAQKTAQKLKIPFHLIDLTEIFKEKIIERFLKDYASGLTPNPCVICNQLIKFGELLDYIRKLGFDYLATGHYAQIKKDQERFHLLKGKDRIKDQSYFLYRLKQSQLKHLLFPLGNLKKKEVIKLAKKWHLPVAFRPESQEICFLPEDDYRPFLKRYLKKEIKPGEVVDIKGRIIGQHQGLPLYTVGQRHGFTINSKFQTSVLPPYYIINKDIKKNRLIVGFGKETEKKEFFAKNINWVDENCGLKSLNYNLNCKVRIRHQGEFYSTYLQIQKNKVKITLHEPERGITPGQSAVFYQKDEVLGGGIIVS